VNIRKLGPADDLEGAIHLLQRFFREEGFTTAAGTIAANARRMAGIETCGLFVAEDRGEAIGVATVSLEFGIEYGWSAEMGDLYIIPEWRGRGLARRMVVEIEVVLKACGARGYQVTVAPYASEQHDLAKFYARLGFGNEGRLVLFKEL
jgi:GNAT superfamily N-acetyltransferase